MAKSVTDQAKHGTSAYDTNKLQGADSRLFYCISQSWPGMQSAQGTTLQKSNMQGAIIATAMGW